MIRDKIKLILGHRILQHLAFWVLSFYLIGIYFSVSNQVSTIDFIYAFFFHIPLVFLVYVNLYWVLPSLQKEYYLRFVILLLLNGLAAYLIHELVFEYFIPFLPIDYYIVSFTDTILLIQIFAIYILLSSLLKLSKAWFYLERVKKEKVVWELESLRAQINPHFLLNSLNTIYGLSLSKNPETPEAILKLGNLLKQSLYGSKNNLIPLNEEIGYMKDYLDLQKLRLSKKAVVKFDVIGDISDKVIPPFLLMTFLENSFKHGQNNGDSQIFRFTVSIEHNQLHFRAENSLEIQSHEMSDKKGIGLENIQRRLELIYQDDYKLNISKENSMFKVYLLINKLKEKDLPIYEDDLTNN